MVVTEWSNSRSLCLRHTVEVHWTRKRPCFALPCLSCMQSRPWVHKQRFGNMCAPIPLPLPQSKRTFSEQRVQPLMQAEQPTGLLWSIKYHRQHCPRHCSQSNKGAAGQSRPLWKKPRVEWHLDDIKVRMGGVTGKTGPSSCLHVRSWALQIVLCMFHCGLWQL